MQTLSAKNCPKHWDPDLYRIRGKCGCPDTQRREGFVIYRDPDNAHNWILFDTKAWDWVVIAGDWQTAMNSLNVRIQTFGAK
jgi:hypothetical protein